MILGSVGYPASNLSKRKTRMILTIIAAVLLVVAAFQERVGPVHVGWLGVALWVIDSIV